MASLSPDLPPKHRPHGNLHVTVHEGKDLRDIQLIGKQDPYVKLVLGKQELKTKVHFDGFRNGVWNQTLIFHLKQRESDDTLFMGAKDENPLLDEDIGLIDFDVAEVIESGGFEKQWHRITWKDRSAGRLLLSVHFQPSLHVTVKGCKGLKESEHQEAYLKATYDGETIKTKVHEGDVHNPKWSHDNFILVNRPIPNSVVDYVPSSAHHAHGHEESKSASQLTPPVMTAKERRKSNAEALAFQKSSTLDVQVLNHHLLLDSHVAESKIPFESLTAAVGKGSVFFHLTHEGKPAGEVEVEVTQWKFPSK